MARQVMEQGQQQVPILKFELKDGLPVAVLRQLGHHLDEGGVLVIPTESSYALAVDPRNQYGVDAVFRIKGRTQTKALPVAVASMQQIEALGVDPASLLDRGLQGLWPGTVTVLLPLARRVDGTLLPALGRAFEAADLGEQVGRVEVAVRYPADPALVGLLVGLDRPLTVTSANPAGAEPFLDALSCQGWIKSLGSDLGVGLGEGLGGIASRVIVIDAGQLPGGPPSTLIRCRTAGDRVVGFEVLRSGAMPPAEIASRLGVPFGDRMERSPL